MKKRCLALVLAAVCTLTFAGCTHQVEEQIKDTSLDNMVIDEAIENIEPTVLGGAHDSNVEPQVIVINIDKALNRNFVKVNDSGLPNFQYKAGTVYAAEKVGSFDVVL